MRKRPFTLALSGLVAAAALAVVLTGRGPSREPTGGRPPAIGTGANRACVTTSAVAQSEDRSAIVITAMAEAPVRVTEQVSGPSGVATVSRSEVVTARIKADEPLGIKRTSIARARACATGVSSTAARTAALRAAYAHALARAHALAVREGARALAVLVRTEYPEVLAAARRHAAARAHQLALGAAISLAAEARSEARRRAGG